MATPNYLRSSLARKYYRQMKAGLRNGGQSSSVGASPYALGRIGSQTQTAMTTPIKTQMQDTAEASVGGFGSRLLDIILQPGYATAQSLAEADDAAKRNGDIAGAAHFLNPVEWFKNLGTGNTKRAISDIPRGEEFAMDDGRTYTQDNPWLAERDTDNQAQRILKGVGGFGLDVVGDPLTYVGLGAVGQGLKGAGTLVKGGAEALGRGGAIAKAAEAAGSGVAKAGEGVLKADAAINAIPGKAVGAVKSKLGKTAEEAAPKVGTSRNPFSADAAPDAAEPEDISAALQSILNGADDIPENPFAATTPAVKAPEVKAPEPDTQSFLSELLSDPTPRTLAPRRMLRDVETGEEIPYDPNTARRMQKKAYTDLPVDGAPFSPAGMMERIDYRDQKILNAQRDAARNMDQRVAKDVAAEVTEDVVAPTREVTADDIKSWVADPKNESAPLKFKIGKTTVTTTVGDALNRLSKKAAQPLSKSAAAAYNKAIRDAADSALRAARSAPADAPESVAVRPVSGRRATPRTVTLPQNKGYTDEQIAAFLKKNPEASGDTIAAMERAGITPEGRPAKTRMIRMTGWRDLPEEQREMIKRRYQSALEAEHFEYLYENQARTDLSAMQRRQDFQRRLSNLRKGMALKDSPKYEEFQQYQVVFTPAREPEWPVSPVSKEEAFNEAVGGVEAAPDIIAKVDTSLPATRTREMERISSADELSEDATESIKKVLGSGYISDKVPGQQWSGRNEDFRFTTDLQKSARNSETPGEGLTVNVEAYNGQAQANMFRELMSRWIDGNTETFLRPNGKVDGYARGRAMRVWITEELKTIENYLRAHGIEPIGGTAKTGIPMSLADTLEILGSTPRGEDFLTRRVFGGMWGIAPRGTKGGSPGTVYTTALLRVMGALADAMDATAINAARDGSDDLLKIIRETLNGKNGISTDQMKALLTKNGEIPISTARKAKPLKGEREYFGSDATGWAVDVKGGKAYFGPHSTQILKELEHVLFDDDNYTVVRNLVQTVQRRSAEYGIRYGDNVRQITADSMNAVMNFLDAEPGIKAAVDTLDPAKIVKATAKEKPLTPTPAEVEGATMRMEEDITEVVDEFDLTSMQELKDISKSIRADDVPAKNKTMDATRARVMEEITPPVPDVVSVSLNDQATADITGTIRRLGLFVTSKFVPSRVVQADGKLITVNGLHEAFLKTGSVGRNLSQQVRRDLHQIARTSTKEQQRLAYRFLQNGMRGQADPEVEAVAKQMERINSMFFDSARNESGTTTGILQDFFNRGYDLDHVQAKMNAGHFGIPESLRFDFDAVKELPRDQQFAALHKQWIDMQVDDPIDYMARLDATIGNLAVDTSVSQQSWAKLRELNMVSDKPKPGFVKLTDMDKSIIARYFPGEASRLYVDKNSVIWIQKLDELMQASTNLGGGFGKFVNGVYDPLFGMWKSGMTIWRPGHHVRNLVGDVSLSYLMDGVKNPKYYYQAIDFLKDRKKYDSIDMLRMVQGLPPAKQAEAAGVIGARIGGKRIPVDRDEFYDAMYRRGIIKDFVQQEDLIESTQTNRFIEKMQDTLSITGGRMREKVGSLSEGRDDFVRVAHALHIMDHPPKGIKTLDELFDYAAKRVNQVHPDGSDLTGFERKYMRRIFAFYSWTRKAIPLIVESMVMHPGRVLMYPKFMYSMAEAQGVDLDSMSNPFPEDQLFPSWITERTTGPLWQSDDGSYYGVSPGVTDQDIISEFITPNLKDHLLDMTTPFIKLPIELQTGSTFGSGIQTPGSDPVQYIGSQIPGVSHLQTLSGYDPLGSVGTLVQGQGLDPLLSTQKGNREPWGWDRLVNFLTGAGISNMSTPSIINSAEIEKRDRS